MSVYDYEDITFKKFEAQISDSDGNKIFDETVEFPDFFNQNDVNIIANKYLCNTDKKKETSLKEVINRVSDTIAEWGYEQNYFKSEKERDEFNSALRKYQIHQYCAFNSPVYFNIGLRDDPQISACFILDMKDTMDSITSTIQTEAKIFKQGSGSGMNLSNLRSKYEKVSAGGNASGPVSFLKVADTSAGVIKSGGTLRRSAKMAILNIGHPDIEDFITCKINEDKKLNALKEAGIKPQRGQELSEEVFFQNTNISVRITDDFMNRVCDKKEFSTKAVKSGDVVKTYKAEDLLYKIAENAWYNADPGVQYHDNMNAWNTCSKSGTIVATNPCGEYSFLNNSSCNLASINILKFLDANNQFDFETFKHVVKTLIYAQDIVIDKATYPTKKIRENSIDFRPLGLGYTNLGAFLMVLGYPYDSEEGRMYASMVTALMTGHAYETSGELGSYVKGPFKKYNINKKSFTKVLEKHIEYVKSLYGFRDRLGFSEQLATIWKDILNKYDKFRNSQVTLLAPTGTISFLMGATTTGVEPEFSHVKYKTLANMDGAVIKVSSTILNRALNNLGYTDKQRENITNDILDSKTFDNISDLKDEHKPIFYTTSSTPYIPYKGHLKMLGAVQPFLSGAISKTINMPKDCTIDDVYDVFMDGWKMGLKGVTIYRDSSKQSQPLSSSSTKQVLQKDRRFKIPDERRALNHKFKINQNFKGYLSCGMYDDGKLGEIFIDVAKEGSTLSGILKSLAIVTSISLQYGVPLKELVNKLAFQNFEPSGFTNNKQIPIANSVVDYVFRYLAHNFLDEKEKEELGIIVNNSENSDTNAYSDKISGPPCSNCGQIMVRIGACHLCNNCGFNEGACG